MLVHPTETPGYRLFHGKCDHLFRVKVIVQRAGASRTASRHLPDGRRGAAPSPPLQRFALPSFSSRWQASAAPWSQALRKKPTARASSFGGPPKSPA